MRFTLYPAIDIRGGRCVRLVQGDYGRETVYGDPVAMAKRWVAEGATWLHIVDLDGAREGRPVNADVVTAIVRAVDVPVQVGGGIRTAEAARAYWDRGVRRVILGTAALEDRELVMRLLSERADGVAVGLDARDGIVAVRGWQEASGVRALDLGRQLAALGAQTLIFTDIARDGTLAGPNVSACVELARATGCAVIASGGVRHASDLEALAARAEDGVRGAIVGKALYTGALDLRAALARLGGRIGAAGEASGGAQANGEEDALC